MIWIIPLSIFPPEFSQELVGRILKECGSDVDPSQDEVKNAINRFWIGPNRDDIVEREFKIDLPLFWKVYDQYDTIKSKKNLLNLIKT